LSNADCGAGQICRASDNNEFRCTAGCTTDAQCGAPTPHCNTTASTCVQCLTNPDCAGTTTPICTNGGRCVECTVNTDCTKPGVPFCGDGKTCVQCVDDNQCPAATPKCRQGTCQTKG
jgi:hypothetical protein